MKKYFKFIGYSCLVVWFISFIGIIIHYANVAKVVTTQGIKIGGLSASGHFYYITSLIVSLIFGPSVSLLFIYVSELEDRVSQSVRHATKDCLKFVKLNASRGITFFNSCLKVDNRTIRYNITDLEKTDKAITFMNGNTRYQLHFSDFGRTEEFYKQLKERISR